MIEFDLFGVRVVPKLSLLSIYMRTVSSYHLFSFGSFDSFLTGLGWNQKYSVCCSAQMAHKLVFISVLQRRQQARRAYCPDIYTVCWACLLAILPPKLFSVYERSKGGHEKGSKKIIKVLHCCLLLFMCWCKLQKKKNWNNFVQKVFL